MVALRGSMIEQPFEAAIDGNGFPHSTSSPDTPNHIVLV